MVEVHPSPRLKTGDKALFFLKQNQINPITGTPDTNVWSLSVGPQSVMRYNLDRDAVIQPFGTHTNIQRFLSTVVALNGSQTSAGSSNFYIPQRNPLYRGWSRSVLSFSPTTITAGTKSILTIRGTNFGMIPGSVRFQNANAGGGTMTGFPSDIISWTNTQIEVYVPSGAGTGPFEVVASTGRYPSPSPLAIPYNHSNPGTNTRDYMGRLVDYGGGKLSWEYSANFAANVAATTSFERALETWRCATFINWDVAGATTPSTSRRRDNVNGVYWGQLRRGVLGACWSYYGSCQIGTNLEWYTTELDIVFSPNYTSEYGPALPGPNAYDFETVALHELGHGHQLGHIINLPAPMHASVSPGISKRSLFPAAEVAGGRWVMGRSTAAFGCGIGPMQALNRQNCSILSPRAEFTSNTRQVCPGNQVQYTDQSTGATSWDWRFPGGNPATSSAQNPLVSYASPGSYPVTLIASNASGSDTITKQTYISVAVPAATLSGGGSIIAGNSAWLRFDLTGTSPWNLSYTDGTSTFTVNGLTQSPHYISVSPVSTTTYSVVSISDAQCNGTRRGEALVSVGPPPPLRKGFGVPFWSFSDQTAGQIKVMAFDTVAGPQRSNVPYGGYVQNTSTSIAMDACGDPLFTLSVSDHSRPNSLFVIDMQANVLNPGNGLNSKRDISIQLVNVPGTYNEWYVIYQEFDRDVYAAKPILYSRIRYNCGQITILEKDIVLRDGAGISYLYTIHKAVSGSTPVKPQSHWLYLCRRQPLSNNTSLDRFLIDKQGITWNANTGDIQVPWWGLCVIGSPLELSWQQDKIAVMYRNQSNNITDLVIWDANQFSNTPGAYQMVTVGNLILQPDQAGLVTAPASVYQVASRQPNLGFLQNIDRKMARAEFSPSGQYLYLGGGGFMNASLSSVNYLMQIDISAPYPYPIRIQAESPPFGNYNATTGAGCPRSNANCNENFRFLDGIRSGYDGRLYFFKRFSDTAWVIPNPDVAMPQQLRPGIIDLSTANAPNIPLGPGAVLSAAENIDGYRYPVEGNTVQIIVGVRNCEGCLASASDAQDIEVSTTGGASILCEIITQCPDTLNFCVHPDSVYRLTWVQSGVFYDAAIVNGTVQRDSFIISYSNRPTVRMGTLPTICDTAVQPIDLTGYPTGGTFSGPGVNGSQFFPQQAGKGAHWIVYRYTDSLSKCEGVDSMQLFVEFCCVIGNLNIASSIQNLRCFGDNTGQIEIQATGARYPPLAFSIDRQNYQSVGFFEELTADR
jgi:PKD repeat protein